jgi:hypothetical protein
VPVGELLPEARQEGPQLGPGPTASRAESAAPEHGVDEEHAPHAVVDCREIEVARRRLALHLGRDLGAERLPINVAESLEVPSG